MKISLPNGEERSLSNDISLDEKMSICENLIEEFDEYLLNSNKSNNINYFLSGLANYLCWHKEELGDRDRNNGIMSNGKEKEMERKRYHGRYRKDTLFSDLSAGDGMKIFGEMNENA